MFLGLRTAIYHVPDLAAGKAWYSQVLDMQPYYDSAGYVGFSVGGFELGLLPTPAATITAGDLVETYWGVDNADAALARLLEFGATERSPVEDVGDGIRMATVFDPFGNVLGLIENPHFGK
ncbi:MAG: hypothetical protein MUD01_19025 [Chloroflexaceae bacterium]|jgi:predicted enzyme related to lactoylglutathione lyase|nr:hypothetical protein [Chloroflexaceae bacterium]